MNLRNQSLLIFTRNNALKKVENVVLWHQINLIFLAVKLLLFWVNTGEQYYDMILKVRFGVYTAHISYSSTFIHDIDLYISGLIHI